MAIPSELDLWRSAGIIVRQHGSRAPEEAAIDPSGCAARVMPTVPRPGGAFP
jgi:hypothetical protein